MGLKPQPITVGNIFACRDWSYAGDFVRGVWSIMNLPEPKEYILSSGETHSVKEFIDLAFHFAGITNTYWHIDEETPENTVLVMKTDSDETKFLPNRDEEIVLVKVSKDFYRPAEVDLLLGDSTPVRRDLGWKPQYSFSDLVKMMVESDLKQ